ncbi:MAG: DEAD/DEAH box helicase [Cyanobacteria bacterium J06614_10]
MKVLHGTWIPDAQSNFVQKGAFYLWVEASDGPLDGSALRHFLETDLGLTSGVSSPQGSAKHRGTSREFTPKLFTLPTLAGQLLPSLALSRYLETALPDTFDWQVWEIDCYRVSRLSSEKPQGKAAFTGISAIIPLLKELHFIAQYQLAEVQLGADLLFWYHYTQSFKQVILKDQYIPSLRYRALKKTFETYPHWEIVSEAYEKTVQRYVDHMPLACVSGFASRLAEKDGTAPHQAPHLYDRETLLRHCSDCLLHDIVTRTPLPQSFYKQIEGSLIYSCLKSAHWTTSTELTLYKQWRPWRDRVARTQSTVPFYLCFQLTSPSSPETSSPETSSPENSSEQDWTLHFKVAPKQHPSLRISLADYWRLKPHQQKALKLQLGDTFEQSLLFALGDAARIYPPMWDGLETDEPAGIVLDVDAAFAFLSEAAWVLEDAGYKVIVPAWWTPQGRRRAQLKLKASSQPSAEGDPSKSYFSFDTLVDYQYELSIGGEKVSEREWQQLVAAQAPLVQFRGQWMALDKAKMHELLDFWQQQRSGDKAGKKGIGLLDFMQMAAQQGEDIEVDFSRDRTLLTMMNTLTDTSALVPVENPPLFAGQLRAYQQRGVSWLSYLESLGLNGCLADDMGLGKTVQVIARLLQEAAQAEAAQVKRLPPTLLIAPTSVLGNWHRELQRFAPTLSATVHHGSDRTKQKKAFQKLCQTQDLIITSFALARRDSDLIGNITWHRIVLDEAQNIKNPKAAQTKAILKLSSRHRLALTGTPIENRLLDLWSIFNFLNPGYLGKESQFRKHFELPIQRNNDRQQSRVLKKLVEPFILRRVKTDEAIIKDLPSKVEQKLYCNLTKEQASLYEATVRDVEKQLQNAEGIQRKGLILATLMKLKQICNHPAQFLQDGSDFTAKRSHKLSRLSDMVAEAIADGDSLLIFTQFREIGDALDTYLHQTHHYNTYYLHGGTSRKKRDKMMRDFQSSETAPSIFVLSLKAGGVGITLTKANHVFHFDRWWNPAVEDQATDRAFRIGQKKNVFVHKFVSIGTLEERIDQMIEDKKKLAGSIVGSDESWLTELDNDAFKRLIALNKSAIMD